MRSIWAVTRQTFIECVRTRIFATFLVLLGACVVTLALTAEGDGSLKGRIQTFLAYSTSVTQMLLALVTIFMATGIVAGDVRRKTIFTVASKPLRRWQYVLGRWLGIVALNAVLLAAALGLVYGLAQYLRGQPTRTEQDIAAGQRPTGPMDLDRLAVESGIFTARARHKPDPIDLGEYVKNRFDQLKQEKGGEDELIRQRLVRELRRELARDAAATLDEARLERMLRDMGTREATLEKIKAEIREQKLGDLLLVRPGRGLRISFSGLKLPKGFDEPIQLRYRLRPMSQPASQTLKSLWQFHHPSRPFRPIYRTDSAEAASSFELTPRAVTDDGKLLLYYVNLPANRPDVKLRLEEFTLMYRLGSFGGNIVRAGMLMLLRLMFLAGAGVLFGAFLSFPVACLVCMMVLGLGLMSGFIAEATAMPAFSGVKVSPYDYFTHYLAQFVFLLLPDFAGTSPVDSLVDGAFISYRHLVRESLAVIGGAEADSNWLWQKLGFQMRAGAGLRTLLCLAMGCLIFWRRELARIQV